MENILDFFRLVENHRRPEVRNSTNESHHFGSGQIWLVKFFRNDFWSSISYFSRARCWTRRLVCLLALFAFIVMVSLLLVVFVLVANAKHNACDENTEVNKSIFSRKPISDV